MATPKGPFVKPDSDLDSYGGATSPQGSGTAAKNRYIDSTKTSAEPNATVSDIPDPDVLDLVEKTNGTPFGPNSRGLPNTLVHNDGHWVAPVG